VLKYFLWCWNVQLGETARRNCRMEHTHAAATAITERNAMDANEKYVREHCFVHNSGTARHPRPVIAGAERVTPYEEWDKAWSAAAEFTRERLEQIRQVEEEISVITHEYKKATVCGVSMGAATGKVLIWQRVLAREHAALADLRRGMK
jgi:hypothetical protein